MGIETMTLGSSTKRLVREKLAKNLRTNDFSASRTPGEKLLIRWVGDVKLSKTGVKYNVGIENAHIGSIEICEFDLNQIGKFRLGQFTGAKMPSAYLYNFKIEESYRKIGFGSTLLDFVECVALSEGMKYTILHAEPERFGFYIKRGYNLVYQGVLYNKFYFFQKDIRRK